MNRPAALAVVAVAGVAALAVGVGGWTNTGTKSSRQTFDQKITEVRLDTRSGDVEVLASGEGKVQVEQRVRKFWLFPAKPKKIEVDGDALVLPGDCGVNCSVSYTVHVPAGTKVTGESGSGTVELDSVASVDVRLGSGDVSVRNVPGPVSVQTSSGVIEADHLGSDAKLHAASGDISVDDVAGTAELHANSGTIHVDNARQTVDAETGSGDISVDLVAPASVRAKAGSGSVEVRAPESSYKVVTHTGSGDADVDIPDDASGRFTLDVSTSSGDVSIGRS